MTADEWPHQRAVFGIRANPVTGERRWSYRCEDCSLEGLGSTPREALERFRAKARSPYEGEDAVRRFFLGSR